MVSVDFAMLSVSERLVLSLLFFTNFKTTWSLMKNDQKQIMGRVTGGVDAINNSASFIVSFQYQSQHYCAGSIINKNWILTAAHCLKTNKLVKNTIIVAGTTNIKDIAASAQRRTIDHFLVNDLYTGDIAPYDIGLAFTNKPFAWSAAVKAIDLPSNGYTSSGNAVLYGWGSTSKTNSEDFPSILQEATVTLIPLKVCAAAMGPKSIYIHDTNICTGPLSSRVGICQADSGGPLIQEFNDKTILIGVASWGKTPCGQLNSPSVYVKVSSVVSWIEKHQVLPK